MTNDRKVLVVDVGALTLSYWRRDSKEAREITSGPRMTAADMVRKAKKTTKDWGYEVISIGYPGPVIHGRPLQDPHNLSPGWVNVDFHKAFGRPVRHRRSSRIRA